MTPERLVVIGGDAAGMSAASVARRRKPDLEIVVLERGRFTSYAACGIPYYVGALIRDPASLITRSPEAFRRKQNIDVRTRCEATAIDLKNRSVDYTDLETSATGALGYDKLLIATGAEPIVPPIEGLESRNVFAVAGLQSGLDMRAALDGDKPRRAVVVGGGYIGIEMAEALKMRGCDVVLVEKLPQVMATMDADMAGLVADALGAEGVEVRLEQSLTCIEADVGGRVRKVHTDRGAIETEFVVLGIGIRPNSGLAEAAGLPLGARGAVRTNRQMRTTAEGVWSAGDCAESMHLVSGKPVHVALGTVANKHGRVAGTNIAGGSTEFPGVVGTAITKFFDTEIARTGLCEREIAEAGIEAVGVKIESQTRAHYYPDSAPITVKMHAEKGSGRLLGVQIVGGPGSGKRIDAAATALHARLTIGQMINLDLAYAPPFSPVWDPLLTAARVMESET